MTAQYLKFGPHHYLPHPFKFIVHQPHCHSTLHRWTLRVCVCPCFCCILSIRKVSNAAQAILCVSSVLTEGCSETASDAKLPQEDFRTALYLFVTFEPFVLRYMPSKYTAMRGVNRRERNGCLGSRETLRRNTGPPTPLWDVTSCGIIDMYRRFRGSCRFRVQGER